MSMKKKRKPYEVQLKDPRWLELRQKVLERDDCVCSSCGRQQSAHQAYQVHHKDYRPNAMAWEYPLEDLVTMCDDCHGHIHSYLESIRKLVRRMDPDELEVFVHMCFGRFHSWMDRTGGTSRIRYWRECSEIIPRSEDKQ